MMFNNFVCEKCGKKLGNVPTCPVCDAPKPEAWRYERADYSVHGIMRKVYRIFTRDNRTVAITFNATAEDLAWAERICASLPAPSPAPQGTEAAKADLADLVKLASDLAQAVVDQDSDGLDRSGWILETAREFIGAKERQPAPPADVNRELLEACRFALRDVETRLYMLPVDGPGVSEQKDILSAQIGRYRGAIKSAEARHDPS